MVSSLWQFCLTMPSNVAESPIWTTATVLAFAFEVTFIVCGCALLAALAHRGSDETRGRPGHGGSPLGFPDGVGAEDWFVWQPACQV